MRTCSEAVARSARPTCPDRPGGGSRGLGELPRDALEFARRSSSTLSRMLPTLLSGTRRRSVAVPTCAARRRQRPPPPARLAAGGAPSELFLKTARVRAISPISSMRSVAIDRRRRHVPLAIAVSEARDRRQRLGHPATISMVSIITSSAAMPAAIAMLRIDCGQHGLVAAPSECRHREPDGLSGRRSMIG